jgi:hypothetical protein
MYDISRYTVKALHLKRTRTSNNLERMKKCSRRYNCTLVAVVTLLSPPKKEVQFYI